MYDGDWFLVRDSSHDQEGGGDETTNCQRRVGGQLVGVAHHHPLDEHTEPCGHHAVDQEVDTGVGDQEKVGDSLRVEDVGRWIVGSIVLHAVDWSFHSGHG